MDRQDSLAGQLHCHRSQPRDRLGRLRAAWARWAREVSLCARNAANLDRAASDLRRPGSRYWPGERMLLAETRSPFASARRSALSGRRHSRKNAGIGIFGHFAGADRKPNGCRPGHQSEIGVPARRRPRPPK